MKYTLYNIRLTKEQDTVTHKQMYETGSCGNPQWSCPGLWAEYKDSAETEWRLIDINTEAAIPDKWGLLMSGWNQYGPLSDYNQIPVFHLSFRFYPEK